MINYTTAVEVMIAFVFAVTFVSAAVILGVALYELSNIRASRRRYRSVYNNNLLKAARKR